MEDLDPHRELKEISNLEIKAISKKINKELVKDLLSKLNREEKPEKNTPKEEKNPLKNYNLIQDQNYSRNEPQYQKKVESAKYDNKINILETTRFDRQKEFNQNMKKMYESLIKLGLSQ